MGLILRDVDTGARRVSVRVQDGVVVSVGKFDPRPGDDVIEGNGGALIPGLHDHHLHVLALAAARLSVDVSPAAIANAEAFETTIRRAAARGPVRATGYHERVYGSLDRDVLDALVPDAPVRVQHRTGGLWVLNSRALEGVDRDRVTDARIERQSTGRLSGRVWRGDDLVQAGARVAPETVAEIGHDLAALGITAVTDATPSNNERSIRLLRGLPQRVRVMGSPDLACEPCERVVVGEVKVLLDDDRLPDLDDLAEVVRGAHASDRGVAVHCVTLVQLRFTIELFRRAGVRGDRIEHASVAPPDAVADLCRLGLRVVTQPAFLAARGDDYLSDVDPRDVGALYPIASLLAAGLQTRASSDAPYGPLDPWAGMRAAVSRRTASGAVVNEHERVDAAAALALYTDSNIVAVGLPADLVMLSVSYEVALDRLSADDVVLTVINGEVVHDARALV